MFTYRRFRNKITSNENKKVKFTKDWQKVLKKPHKYIKFKFL